MSHRQLGEFDAGSGSLNCVPVELVRRTVSFVELDRLDVQGADPVRLVCESIPQRLARVLLAEKQVDGLRVTEFDERIDTHG